MPALASTAGNSIRGSCAKRSATCAACSFVEHPLLGHRVTTCANLLVWFAMMALNATGAREIVQTSELTARTSGGVLLL